MIWYEGDYIVCIRKFHYKTLTIGKSYKITSSYDNRGIIYNDLGRVFIFGIGDNKFMLLEEYEIMQRKNKIKKLLE